MTGSKKKNRRVFFMIAVLIGAMAALIAMEYGNTMSDGRVSPSDNQVIKTIEFETAGKADFYTFDSYIYYCTKDGIQLLDSEGETLWNDTYTMTAPYMTYDEDVVGVCEPNGRNVRIYNRKGKLYSIDTEMPVVNFSINSNGYSSIVTSSEREYRLNVYNSNGENMFYGSFQPSDGMPVASDISNDNKILAVSFLSINDIDMQSKILFYYINNLDADNVETSGSMFASFLEEDCIAAVLHFFDDNSIAAVTDKNIICFEVSSDANEKYREKWSFDLKNRLDVVSVADKKYIYAAYGERLINVDEPYEKGTVHCFDAAGNRKCEIFTERKITGLYPRDDAVIIAMDRKFQAYSSGGSFRWEYNAVQDVNKILFVEEPYTILFVGTNKAEIIKLNERYNNEEETSEQPTTAEESTETETEETTTEQISEETEEQTTQTAQERSNVDTSAVQAAQNAAQNTNIKSKTNHAVSDEKTEQTTQAANSEPDIQQQTESQENLPNTDTGKQADNPDAGGSTNTPAGEGSGEGSTGSGEPAGEDPNTGADTNTNNTGALPDNSEPEEGPVMPE